jgi:hypothetical protein
MIVDDLDIMGVAVTPSEANAPLVVDSDAVLPFAIPGEPLQPITGWRPQVFEIASIVNLHQLTISRLDDVVGNALYKPALPCSFDGGIPKRLDHGWLDTNVPR